MKKKKIPQKIDKSGMAKQDKDINFTPSDNIVKIVLMAPPYHNTTLLLTRTSIVFFFNFMNEN
jgi:hypothetical protein